MALVWHSVLGNTKLTNTKYRKATMHIHGNPKCRPLKLKSFLHPISANKPGTLYLVDIATLAPDLFPHGCPASYFIIAEQKRSTRRGAHGHPVGSKAEIFVVLVGRALVTLHSTEGCGTVELDQPDDALLVIPGVWHSVDLEAGSILLVYSSLTMEETQDFTELPCQCPRP